MDGAVVGTRIRFFRVHVHVHVHVIVGGVYVSSGVEEGGESSAHYSLVVVDLLLFTHAGGLS